MSDNLREEVRSLIEAYARYRQEAQGAADQLQSLVDEQFSSRRRIHGLRIESGTLF
jgi:hypothetical protein